MNKQYEHGADIYKYEKQLIDYSSNINPLGVPASFKEALISHIDLFSQYPDHRYEELKIAIEDYTGCERETIFVDNGLVELMRKVLKYPSFKRLVTLAPTFLEYKKMALEASLEYCSIPLDLRSEGAVFNHKNLLDEVYEGDVVILCNPNNPTGSLLSLEEMIDLASEIGKRQGYLVIDEAFMKLTRDHGRESFIQELKNFPHVMVFRAVTKYFGIPGARMGYGMTYDKAMQSYLTKVIGPWQLNTSAELSKVVFRDEAYQEKTAAWLKEDIQEMEILLRQIPGIRVYRSETIFFLIRLEKKCNEEIIEAMIEKGYLLRHHLGFEGLDEHHLRIAVKDRESNRDLVRNLRGVLDASRNL